MAYAHSALKAKVYRDLGPTPWAISATAAAYFLGALAIETFDTLYLLMAWLMAGFLAMSLYASKKGHPVNGATAFFTLVVGGCIAMYFLSS